MFVSYDLAKWALIKIITKKLETKINGIGLFLKHKKLFKIIVKLNFKIYFTKPFTLIRTW